MAITFAAAGTRVQMTQEFSDFSFVIAIDASYSMETTDILPSRFGAAKSAAKTFIDVAPSSSDIAVVSFSGTPFIEQEPTNNKELLKNSLENIELNRVGGTNILSAVVTSSNLLWNKNAKAIILISDGQISVDTVEDIVDYSNRNGVVLNTFGVGSEEGKETDIGFISQLDEQSLQSMAYETGGMFFRITTKDQFEESIKEVLNLSRSKVMVEMKQILILFSAVLFLIIFFLSNLRYKSIP